MLSLTQEKRACRLQELNIWFRSRLFIVFIITKMTFISTHACRWRSVWVDGAPILLMFWLCFLFIIDVYQTSRPSAPSGTDIYLLGFLSLSLKCVMNVGGSIWNNSRNCNLRILPDCHISICYYLHCIRVLVRLPIDVCVLVYHRVVICFF